MNTAVFMRILTKSRRKYAAKNRLGFGSFYLNYAIPDIIRSVIRGVCIIKTLKEHIYVSCY